MKILFVQKITFLGKLLKKNLVIVVVWSLFAFINFSIFNFEQKTYYKKEVNCQSKIITRIYNNNKKKKIIINLIVNYKKYKQEG